jgi:hypothetical protein
MIFEKIVNIHNNWIRRSFLVVAMLGYLIATLVVILFELSFRLIKVIYAESSDYLGGIKDTISKFIKDLISVW